MNSPVRPGAAAVVLLLGVVICNPIHSHSQDAVDSARKVLVQTAVSYPPLARSMNVRGVVKVEAQVEPNGTVKAVSVKGGHPLLAQAAVTAVMRWRFEPGDRETKVPIELKFNPNE